MKYILWMFSEKNARARSFFLLCTILLDFLTIISYTTTGIAIPTVAFCVLLVVNILSSAGTVANLIFTITPDVCGFRYSVAKRLLAREWLKCSIICDDVYVIGQNPTANKLVRKGTKVRLETAKFTDDGVMKKVNVAIDEIPEYELYQFRSSLAMAGKPNSTNKHMLITEKDGTETDVEVVFTFEFVDSGHEFIVYCEGLYEDDTPKLCFSRLVDGMMVEIEKENWERIRILIRYLGYAKDPFQEERIEMDGTEIFC